MSTRCVINFTNGADVVAKVYRHHDGYPDGDYGVLQDLQQFFSDTEKETMGDTRFDDPSYLAAKFVVWQARQNGSGLKFTGVGVLLENPTDIVYEYFVNSGFSALGGPLVRPKVTQAKVR